MLRAVLPGLAAALVLSSGPRMARAGDESTVTSDVARIRASELFERGRRLFEAGDFLAAAESFEQAYAEAPHPSASWNAARSWHRAGDLPRAAMLYQRYLREAPWDAPDRDEAGRNLSDIRPSLGRIQVVPPGAKNVTVDGRPLEYDEIWVVPGAHIVESTSEGAPPVARKVDVSAGGIVSVAIEGPVAAPPPVEPVAPPRRDDAVGEADGWPSWAILPFAGATLVAGGALVASGIDTETLYGEFERSGNTSAYAYDNGKFAMHRTNVLIAVTSGLAAVTAGVALFAIDWNGEEDGGRVVGFATPRGLDARTTF